MNHITKGLANRGVPNIKIKETLVQLSQRCSVELTKLSDKFIKRYTRRRKVKRLKAETKHKSNGHSSSLKSCVNTLKQQDHQNSQINRNQCKRGSGENDHHRKKNKRINERFRELFGDDDDCSLEQPVKKLKRTKDGGASTAGKISERDKVHGTNCIEPDEEWNKMGLPSPAQRSKSILSGEVAVNDETPSQDELNPEETSHEDVSSVNEMIETPSQDELNPEEISHEDLSSVNEMINQEESSIRVGSIRVRSLSELTNERVQELPTHTQTRLEAEEARKQFWIAYKFYFNEMNEDDIKKLGELLWLAGTYYNQKKDRIERAKQLSSEDLAMEEKQRAELNFLSLIRYRGSEFVPLFLEMLQRFQDSNNRRTLFITLFCKILHHAQSFNSDNSLSLNSSYIDLSREVTSLMVSNYKPDFDIFKDYKINPDEFVKYVEKSYQLIFPVDGSQNITNDIKDQQVNVNENDNQSTGVITTSQSMEKSLSPAASHPNNTDFKEIEGSITGSVIKAPKSSLLPDVLQGPEEQQIPSNDAHTMALDSIHTVNSQITSNPHNVSSDDMPSVSNIISRYSEISLLPLSLNSQGSNQEVSVIRKANGNKNPSPQLTKEPSTSTIPGTNHTINFNYVIESQDINLAVSSQQVSSMNHLNKAHPRFNPKLPITHCLSEQNIEPNQINSKSKTNYPNPSVQEINPQVIPSNIVRTQMQLVSQQAALNLPSQNQPTNSNANLQHNTGNQDIYHENSQTQGVQHSSRTELHAMQVQETSRTELNDKQKKLNSMQITSAQSPPTLNINTTNMQSARANTQVSYISKQTDFNLPPNSFNSPSCWNTNIQDVSVVNQDVRQPISSSNMSMVNPLNTSKQIYDSHLQGQPGTNITVSSNQMKSIPTSRGPNQYYVKNPNGTTSTIASNRLAYVSQQMAYNPPPNTTNLPTYSNASIQGLKINQARKMLTMQILNKSQPRNIPQLQGVQRDPRIEFEVSRNQTTSYSSRSSHDCIPKDIAKVSTQLPRVSQQNTFNLPSYPCNKPTNSSTLHNPPNSSLQQQSIRNTVISQPQYPVIQNHPSYSGPKNLQSVTSTQLECVKPQIKPSPPLYLNNQSHVANSNHRSPYGPRMKSVNAQTNRLVTKAVEEFMALQSHPSPANMVEPTSNQHANPTGLTRNAQDNSIQSTPQLTKPNDNYNTGLNMNSAHSPSGYGLTTQQNMYLLIQHPPNQPQPVANPAGNMDTHWLHHYLKQPSQPQTHRYNETISQATWLQPTPVNHVVSKPGSNLSNLKLIQRLPQNVNLPSSSSQQMRPEDTQKVLPVRSDGTAVELYP